MSDLLPKVAKSSPTSGVNTVAALDFDAFVTCAGVRHAPLVHSLWADEKLMAIALFTDAANQRKALLPVGPNRNCTTVEQALAARPGDLRPRYLLVRKATARPNLDVVQNLPAEIARRDQRERDLERLQHQLDERERYVAQCEARLADLMQELSERESALDQRADELAARERRLRREFEERAEDRLAGTPNPFA